MSDALVEFTDFLLASGYRAERGSLVADNKYHRLFYLDEKQSSGRYSLEVKTNGFAVAHFGSEKDPLGMRGWHSKSTSKMLPAEIAAIAKVAEEQKIARVAADNRRQEKISRLLTNALDWLPPAIEHQYLEIKGVKGYGVLLRAKGAELIIPMHSGGKIWSVQRILVNGRGRVWKGAWKGGRMKGCYFPIMEPDESREVIIFTEGYATAASIREATGLPMVVAFSAGNLKLVVEEWRAKYPQAIILIAADDDAYTKLSDGTPFNAGIEKATRAAEVVGGYLVVPLFANAREGLTDFNDLHLSEGLETVKKQIQHALDEIPVTQDEADAGFRDLDSLDLHPGVGDFYEEQRGDFDMDFRVLGYNDGHFYYFPFAARQIVALSSSSHNIQNLLQLDDLRVWEKRFGTHEIIDKESGEIKTVKSSHGKVAVTAQNAMMCMARSRGVFVEENRVRGAGAWVDEGRVVLHCGDTLFVNGDEVPFDAFKSHFTYVAAPRLMRPANQALSNYDANKLRIICEALTWENKLSGSLLAGWLVIAPICAAMEYRPHLYITGEAESGKSTVMDMVVKPVLGKMSLNVDGGTTEPAIRDMMGYDARPLVYDEGEPSPSMQAVIELARKATSGSTVKKYGQKAFKARFCACFSAITPPVNKTADESRISFLVIKKNKKHTAIQDYDDLMALIDETITSEFCGKLIARTLDNMPALMENIKIFRRAARKITGGARAAQQIGTLIAGLYLLGRTDVVTLEAAEKWIAQHKWDEHTIIDEQTDPVRLVQHIAGSLVRYAKSGADISVGELISMAYKENDASAKKLLRQHCIVVDGEWVSIASRSQAIGRMLHGTDWETKWSRPLGDVEGSEKRKSVYFMPGLKTSAVALPIKYFIEEDE